MVSDHERRQVVVVTGAASGIGRACAELLARRGACVLAADVDASGVADVAARLVEDGCDAVPVTVDVTDDTSVAAMAKAVVERGAVSGLVNCAGVTTVGSLMELTTAQWERTLAIDLTSVYRCTRALLPALREHGGSVVNVASVHQRVAAAGLPAYSAAKGGVVALTRQLAVEHGGDGIRVNAVSPGFVDTPATRASLCGEDDLAWIAESTPLGRPGDPSEVAAVVAFLLGPDSSFVTATELVVDGGSSAVYGMSLLRPGLRARLGREPLQRPRASR